VELPVSVGVGADAGRAAIGTNGYHGYACM
jgi:hypothetical protein